jgi:AraC-like DNA-binding protein
VFVVPPSRAVWVPAAVQHAIDITGPVSMRTLYLSPELWARAPRHCRVIEVNPLLRELIVSTVARAGLDRRRARDARLLGVLLDQIGEGSPLALQILIPKDARAERVARRVQADPGGRKPLSVLTHGAGASARTVERLFRAEVGVSFGQWQRQVRLIHALQRLAAGDKVTAAAIDAGYAGVSAFISAFRKHFGETPGSYLRAHAALDKPGR